MARITRRLAWWIRPRDTLQNHIKMAYPFRMSLLERVRFWLYKKLFDY